MFSAEESLFSWLENRFLPRKKKILKRNRERQATAGSSPPGSWPVFGRYPLL